MCTVVAVKIICRVDCCVSVRVPITFTLLDTFLSLVVLTLSLFYS